VAERITVALPDGAQMAVEPRELWGAAVEAPDPLVYWSAAPPAGARLPEGARLLGSLAQARFALPGAGFLVLYSQAHGKGVAVAPAPKEMP
jgi:hypothetical protein